MSENKKHLILGIDPGSFYTGFGLVLKTDDRMVHVAHGTIVLDKRKTLSERIGDLALDLTTIVKKYEPTEAAVEDLFLFKNPRSALVLGQARGAVLAVLGLSGLLVHHLAPTVVKSMVTGSGRAKKFQVAQMVALELGISLPQSSDASDALAIALAHGHSI